MAKAVRRPREAAENRQLPLGDGLTIWTKVVSAKADFDGLFEGFIKMRAISYVFSSDLLREFFDKRGYTDVEVLVGENLTPESLKEDLGRQGAEITQRLAERVVGGALRVYVPNNPSKTIHTKLYILEREGLSRVIESSANFTYSARRAGHQLNHATVMEFTADHPLLQQYLADYRSHFKDCSLFMGDLLNLLRERTDTPEKEVVEVWLKGESAGQEDLETKRVLQELTFNVLKADDVSQEAAITLRLPDSPVARKQVEKFLAPLQPITSYNEARVNGLQHIRFIQETRNIPLMRVDLDSQHIRIGWDDKVNVLTAPPSDQESVGKALEHLEAYIQSVDWGTAPDPAFVKASMMEAILYVFASPFANEYMKQLRDKLGPLTSRVPQFLYISGEASSGKSKFLEAALHFLTGLSLKPLQRADFTKAKILDATSIGTIFPLIYDDVTASGIWIEDVLKGYWANQWKDEFVQPQIIMSSNAPTLRGWADKRVKHIIFDVHFPLSIENEQKINALLAPYNPCFLWFSHLYLQHLKRGATVEDDELQLARSVMKELYDFAGRSQPAFLLQKRIEDVYDFGRVRWRDLLGRLKQANVTWATDRVDVALATDMEARDIRLYEGLLPREVSHRRSGKILIVQPPERFKSWLGERLNESPSYFQAWWGEQFPSPPLSPVPQRQNWLKRLSSSLRS